MPWNYRVVKRTYPTGETEYGVHEAHYNKGEAEPHSITGPVDPYSEDFEGLKKVLKLMTEATEKEVLVYENFRS